MVAQQTPQYVKQYSWIVDVGASHHITADVNAFNQVTPFESSEKITIGNGTGLTINNIGSTILKHNSHELILNNVLHFPKIARSLLFVQQYVLITIVSLFVTKVSFLCKTRRQRRFCIKKRVSLGSCFKY